MCLSTPQSRHPPPSDYLSLLLRLSACFDWGLLAVQGWFDDRVECRNALSKLSKISEHDSGMDRKDLPWMETDERSDHPRIFNLNVDNLARWGKRRHKRAVAEPQPQEVS